MWLEYSPSRRSTTPFSPSSAAARTSSLYSAENLRRRARSSTSGSGRYLASSATRPKSSILVLRVNVAACLTYFERVAGGGA